MMNQSAPKPAEAKISHTETAAKPLPSAPPAPVQRPKETGGPSGLEPTRYGDWEHKGRCIDF
jgi:shikimate dehydrogenase